MLQCDVLNQVDTYVTMKSEFIQGLFIIPKMTFSPSSETPIFSLHAVFAPIFALIAQVFRLVYFFDFM